MKSQPATVRTTLGALIGAVALAACGGGGGSNPAPAAPPTVTISTSPTAVATGGTSTITWSSTGATSCTASGGWSGARAASGTETVGPISAPTTYTLSCTGTGGSGSASATLGFNAPPTVSLSANPNVISPAQTTTLTWTSTNSTSCTASGAWSGAQATTGTFTTGPLAATSTFTLSCTGVGGSAQGTVSVFVGPQVAPSVQLTARQSTVFIGDPAILDWITQGVTGCVASGGWSGTRTNSGSAFTPPLTATTTFTLTCDGPAGPVSASTTITAAPPPPPVVNISVTPNSVTAGSSAQLSWNAGINSTCTASGGWSGPRATVGQQSTGPVAVTTTFTLTCTGAGGATSASTTLTVTGPNTPPIANAGTDLTVRSADTVFLNGFGSSDPGGSVAGYAWTQTGGPTVDFRNTIPGGEQIGFAAPVSSITVTLTFSLVVTDNVGLSSAADTVTVTVEPPAGGVVTLRGRLTYERVPFSATLGAGLDFTATRREPSRGVSIELLNELGFPLARGGTDANGEYAFDAPANRSVQLRARSELVRAAPAALPHWNVRVRDAVANQPAYLVASPLVNVSSTATSFDLNIPSGWDAVTRQPIGQRLAAPFAILDTVYRAIQTVTAVAPTADFPMLTIDWSPSNPAGATFYDSDDGGPNRRISLAGQINADIDEYDPHTIAHEFGHYLEDRFSRSDSIGGPHTFGDRLDPRVAFGEGFGYAFSAIVLNDPQIRDAGGNNQASELFFNIETDATTAEGWYSEGSVQEILWDLFDANNEGSDAVTLGFAPIWTVLTGEQRSADSLTTIFPFIASLKAQNPASAAQIDGIVAAEAIVAPSLNAYATTETNAAQSADVLPVYTNIGVGTGTVTVRSINTFGIGNKLSNRRFLRLDIASPQRVRVRANIAAAPRDPDIVLWRRGVPAAFGISPTNEDFFADLDVGTYIVEAYDCGNADCGPDAPGPFDIAVTISTN